MEFDIWTNKKLNCGCVFYALEIESNSLAISQPQMSALLGDILC